MNNNQENNSSQSINSDIGKKAGKGAKHLLKNSKKYAKIAKALISKAAAVSLKSVLGIVLPIIIIAVIVLILVLIVIDSVTDSDFFQLGAERTQNEKVFEESVNSVIRVELQKGTNEAFNEMLTGKNPAYQPTLSAEWLSALKESLTVSPGFPLSMVQYRNMKVRGVAHWYKKFYKEYSSPNEHDFDDVEDKDVSVEDKMKVYSQYVKKEWQPILDDTAPEYTYVQSTDYGDEWSHVKGETVCIDEEGNESVSEFEYTNKIEPRKLPKTAHYWYNLSEIEYKFVDTGWLEPVTTSSGNCTTVSQSRYEVVVIDGSVLPEHTILTQDMIIFLVQELKDLGKGKKSYFWYPVNYADVEFFIEDLVRTIDPDFPKLDINYKKLKSCMKKNKKDITPCVLEHVGNHINTDFKNFNASQFMGDYMSLYKEAAEACGIDWFVLAAIHGVETTYSQNPVATDPSKGSVVNGELIGAVGHFQFMPLTWVGWGIAKDYPTSPLGNLLVDDLSIITSLENIAKYRGYGLDANKDGKADPWDVVDAAYSAACYLKANGYKSGNEASIRKAIQSYNHSNSYVNKVYNLAMSINGGFAEIPVAEGTFTYPAIGRISSPYGYRGNAFHYGVDIASGGKHVPIVAAADGVVSRSEYHYSYGNVVFIKHNLNGKSYETVYAHMRDLPPVKVGEKVTKGQTIGTMGTTGDSTGIHLHFEVHSPNYVRQATNPLNPLTIIPKPPTQ